MDDGEGADLRARLGVVAASLLEEAHTHCVNLEALRALETPQTLLGLADDLQALARAIDVVARRWA